MNNVQKYTERSVGDHALRWSSWQFRFKVVLALASIVVSCTDFSRQAIAEERADKAPPTEIESSGIESSETEASETEASETEASVAQSPAAAIFQQAESLAAQAMATAQTAATAPQWDTVMAQWIEAITLLQTIPPESPSRTLAQRQMRGYLQQLQDAQRRAEQSSPGSGFASLGSALFDAQLAGYLSYVETVGTPDVLIVGSSRALQGIDPHTLQQALAAQGYGDLNVYNFSVNGATAQVVEFVVGNLLPEPLPPIVVWGDGSRAFNESRSDRTWESLRSSPGYRAVQATSGQTTPTQLAHRVTASSPLVDLPGNLDVLGFSTVSDRFDPQTYYQQIPKVEGRYDGAYAGFALNGAQANALGRLTTKMQRQNVQLLFVNLPLSGSYLAEGREFERKLQTPFLQVGDVVASLSSECERAI